MRITRFDFLNLMSIYNVYNKYSNLRCIEVEKYCNDVEDDVLQILFHATCTFLFKTNKWCICISVNMIDIFRFLEQTEKLPMNLNL